ncbi:MAG TPA: FKBP-type peptidyl-prolyl cis-trans isomerase [Acidobacteriaceae bacterium]|jgi:peptidylprolyl isomerase|nr:FKBP-type peptidyl-prolyl cis-trans isomerase [Acidobacteriaceae bacterium]
MTFLAVAALASGPATAQLAPKAPPPPTHRPVPVVRCALAQAELSPKIPPPPAGLGCPKVEYALTYLDLKVGTGAPVESRKWTTVQYTGYLTDGAKFDSSYDHGQPFTFPYGAHRVIPGWDTGFAGMRIGGKRRLFIPYQLAYGEMGRPPVIPPKAELIFDVEVLSQSDTPPETPVAPGLRPEPPAAGVHPPPGANPAAQPQTPEGTPQKPAPQTPPASNPQ